MIVDLVCVRFELDLLSFSRGTVDLVVCCEELLATSYWVELETFVMRRKMVGKSVTADEGDEGVCDSVSGSYACTFVLVFGVVKRSEMGGPF